MTDHESLAFYIRDVFSTLRPGDEFPDTDAIYDVRFFSPESLEDTRGMAITLIESHAADSKRPYKVYRFFGLVTIDEVRVDEVVPEEVP